jgi:hypothetical protein
MQDFKDGESIEMQGSGVKPYTLKNTGGVYSCSCPAWRNQSLAIERRVWPVGAFSGHVSRTRSFFRGYSAFSNPNGFDGSRLARTAL